MSTLCAVWCDFYREMVVVVCPFSCSARASCDLVPLDGVKEREEGNKKLIYNSIIRAQISILTYPICNSLHLLQPTTNTNNNTWHEAYIHMCDRFL